MLRMFVSGMILALLAQPLHAQSDHPANNHQIIVTDVKISGVRSIGTDELSSIASALTGKVIDEDDQEISDRLRFSFQDHGYFVAKVNSIKVRTTDALAHPKPVTVEAVADEGPLFNIGEIKFSGNHAYSSEELRAQFPLHKGDIFQRSKIAGGLDGLRVLYSKLGYINFTPLPNTEIAADSVDLQIDIDEGRQYQLGDLLLVGNASLADKLHSRWQLEPGQPFDATYLEKFVDENRSIFPVTFDVHSAFKIGRDCKRALVNLLIDLDPQHPTQRKPEEIPCESRGKETAK